MKQKDSLGTSSRLTRSAAGVSESSSPLGDGCATIKHSVPGLKMANTETLDDFEQRLLRFTTTIKEMCDSALSILSDEEDHVKVIDKVSNVLIGLNEYISQSESDMADDIENHISEQLSREKLTYYVSVKDNYALELPQELIKILGWKEGDTLLWTDQHDGSYKLTKVVQ